MKGHSGDRVEKLSRAPSFHRNPGAPYILKVRTLPRRGPHAPRMGGPPGSPGGPHPAILWDDVGIFSLGGYCLHPGQAPGPPPLAFLSPKNPPLALEPVVAATHLDRKGLPVTRASSPPSLRTGAILPTSPPSCSIRYACVSD